jgi:hypothetical protein
MLFFSLSPEDMLLTNLPFAVFDAECNNAHRKCQRHIKSFIFNYLTDLHGRRHRVRPVDKSGVAEMAVSNANSVAHRANSSRYQYVVDKQKTPLIPKESPIGL